MEATLYDYILVFGSNLAGQHGAGAALYAAQRHAACYGVGEGPTGSAYALPTKDRNIRTLPLTDIREAVVRFLEYAWAHPELKFKVTRVGCGLAGYTDDDIAPMFDTVPPNCGFDPLWSRFGLQTWAQIGINHKSFS